MRIELRIEKRGGWVAVDMGTEAIIGVGTARQVAQQIKLHVLEAMTEQENQKEVA